LQTTARLLLAVTSNAGRLEERLNVFVESDALVSGGSRQFGNINFCDVPFIYLLLSEER
jgi:hypothetical protein